MNFRILALLAVGVWAAVVAAADPRVALGGVTLGESVGSVVSAFGAPGLVETTDQGHEWRWFDQGGLDVDLLTDDDLVVSQILVGRPEAIGGKTSPLVQPDTFPFLEDSSAAAAAAMRRRGATAIAEPNAAVSAWRVGDDYVVLELSNGQVHKLLALDRGSAQRVGYMGSPQSLGAFHAPRLVQQYPVDYPRQAVQARASGVVVVRANISASGSVTSAQVVVSSHNADIDGAELLSIRKSKFRPALCEGQPCAGVYLDREEYSLDT